MLELPSPAASVLCRGVKSGIESGAVMELRAALLEACRRVVSGALPFPFDSWALSSVGEASCLSSSSVLSAISSPSGFVKMVKGGVVFAWAGCVRIPIYTYYLGCQWQMPKPSTWPVIERCCWPAPAPLVTYLHKYGCMHLGTFVSRREDIKELLSQWAKYQNCPQMRNMNDYVQP